MKSPRRKGSSWSFRKLRPVFLIVLRRIGSTVYSQQLTFGLQARYYATQHLAVKLCSQALRLCVRSDTLVVSTEMTSVGF